MASTLFGDPAQRRVQRARAEDARPPRRRCLRCHKPSVSCVCASVTRIQNRTKITIFQHPRERFHPLGTARFAELGLSNTELLVTHAHLPSPAATLSENAVLLYPDPDVPLLTELLHRPSELVVLDGTWHHAKTLLRDISVLTKLKRVRLSPHSPSRYRLRREPRGECLSTIEAILLALQTLEPDLAGVPQLLTAFDQMIDRQIELGAEAARQRRQPQRRRAAAVRLLPRAFAEDFQSLVVVYIERVPTPRGREIIQWVAWRARDAATFEARLPIPEGSRAAHLVPSGIDTSASVEPLSVARRRFAGFAGTEPTFAAWHQRSLDAIRPFLPKFSAACIKAVHRRLYPSASGTLEQCVAHHGLRTYPLEAEGRARQRLGDAIALVQHLTAGAQGNMPAPL